MAGVIPPLSIILLKRVLTDILSWDSFLQVEYENHESPCVYLVGKRRGKCYEGGRGKKGFWRITKEGARGALARIKSSTCGPHRSKTKPSISMPFNLLTWTPFPLFLFSSYAILFVFRRFIPNRPFDPSNFFLTFRILDLKLDYTFFNILFAILNIMMLD